MVGAQLLSSLISRMVRMGMRNIITENMEEKKERMSVVLLSTLERKK